ncbi:c-type cytochrome [Flavihumibacter sp. R14]|nr:c-type cytochrome [Flavihumibacter soli]
MPLNRRLLITIGYIGLVFVISSFAISVKQNDPAPRGNNLKVLPKNISHEELEKIMDGFKDALGVKCGHCHASQDVNPRKLDFASDAKPEKDMARKMIQMTERINKKYFRKSNGEAMVQVQCKTCHRGNTKPEIKPAG